MLKSVSKQLIQIIKKKLKSQSETTVAITPLRVVRDLIEIGIKWLQ